jgi:DNA-binding transcriptional MerR regulator
MKGNVRISEVARRLGVSSQYLRLLEWQGIVPPVRRDYNGRIYTEFDIALLESIGVGQRPAKLKRPEDVLGAAK